METLKRSIDKAGLGLLKSFRGLICEDKKDGWELSKGSVMSWIVLYKMLELVGSGTPIPETLVYMFGGLMGYNAWKVTDVGGALGKMRGK